MLNKIALVDEATSKTSAVRFGPVVPWTTNTPLGVEEFIPALELAVTLKITPLLEEAAWKISCVGEPAMPWATKLA